MLGCCVCGNARYSSKFGIKYGVHIQLIVEYAKVLHYWQLKFEAFGRQTYHIWNNNWKLSVTLEPALFCSG